jgi:hypothetical protein
MANKRTLTAAACLAALAGFTPLASHADPLSQPSMGATLSGNPKPFDVDAGPFGKVYVSGVVSGLGLVQSDPVPGDRDNQADLSNGQIFIQTTSGPIQFFLDVGAYSMPALGTPYTHATTLTANTYSAVPMAYVKFQPNAEWSIQIGKLPSLIGAESAYTFQNINIERGLLWNQEPVFSDGVQVNYAKGKIAASVSFNDGFYSVHRYNWLSGSLAYTASAKDTLTLSGGAALSTYIHATAATPLLQNNGGIVNLIWAHTEGPWMIQPYLQYARTYDLTSKGFPYSGADTWGGAVLAKYSFNANWSLAGRVEYEWSSNSGAVCPADSESCFAYSPLYGEGSKAFSATLTPTYQKGIFFARAEASYTGLSSIAPGSGFGGLGVSKSQFRGLIETGFIF